MIIKGLNEADFVNYQKASMFIIFPKCDFKCDKESGQDICQNNSLIKEPDIYITTEDLAQRYVNNPMTSAVVCGGLEPILSFDDIYYFLEVLRNDYDNHDDFVIYTGYNKDEIDEQIQKLQEFDHVIIKYGRFVPNSKSRYDRVLGVTLQSENQYAERIS